MEKRVFGIILFILGITGLIYGGMIFMNNAGERNITGVFIFCILGAIFFFAGMRLISITRDKAA